MAPEPVRCYGYGRGEPPCSYVSRQGIPTHQLINEDLAMHLRFCTAVTNPATGQNKSGARAQRLDRPEIGEEASDEDWRRFLAAWERYKVSCQLTGEEASIQLYHCCTAELQKTLDGLGIETNCSEGNLTAKIKEAAVRKQNILINTMQFLNTKADGDPARKHAARLNRKAVDCEFKLAAGETDYSKKMVQFQLVHGLEEPEIQEQVFAEYAIKPEMTLEETINFIEAKQLARKDVAELNKGAEVGKVTEYAKGKRGKPGEGKSEERCMYCGLPNHGSKPDEATRKAKCPAWSQGCNKCKKKGHYARRCEKSKKPAVKSAGKGNPKTDDEDEGEAGTDNVVGSMYGAGHFCRVGYVRSSSGRGKLVPHHEWDGWAFVKQEPQRHPEVRLKVSVCREAYRQLKISEPRRDRPQKAVTSMPDTGAMMCLVGMNTIHNMGLRESDLVEVDMRVNAANNRRIPLLGGVFLDLELNGKVSKQLVYVTNEVHCLFLSQKACRDLCIVTDEFPKQVAKCTAVNDENESGEKCTCPKRELPPTPPALPCPATPENAGRLESYLKEVYASSAFNRCERQPLPVMNGSPPCRLFVDAEAKPFAIHKSRPVPVHWQEQVKKDLDMDVRLGILEGPLMDDPAVWCAPMHVAEKKSGKPRRTVDFQGLNKSCQRQTHAVKAPFHQCSAVPPGKFKTTLDAWNGYHSVKLAEEDRHLTTFLTPWGRYRYKNLPQGFLAAGDAYTARYDEITKNFSQMEKCVDDTLLWDSTIEENFRRVAEYLTHCSARGITFNEEKFKFARMEVEFLGYIITADSVRPSEEFLEGIRDFPVPKDVSGVRSWFGLVNQVNYALSNSEIMAPFKALLSPKSKFEWTDGMSAAFTRSKEEIIKAVEKGVRMFEVGRTTYLGTDWSRIGLGFGLMQKHCECESVRPDCCRDGWKIVFAGSRFTTGAESRYHPIEGEALSTAWALHKTRYFTIGCENLIVGVDHKPLLRIFGDKQLNDINNTRILNFKEKTLRWNFTVVHVPGDQHKLADATSRYPVVRPVDDKNWRPWESRRRCRKREEMDSSEDIEEAIVANHSAQVLSALSGLGDVNAQNALEVVQWSKVDEESRKDAEICELGKLVMAGVPEEKSAWPEELKGYYVKDAEYSVVGNVIVINGRVVIPKSLRQAILRILHVGHCGVSGMGSRAREAICWPQMSEAIQRIRDNCDVCRGIAPSQPALPPVQSAVPEYPFQQVATDYFQEGSWHYFIFVCRYSNWLSVYQAKKGDSKELVTQLRRYMATFGVMDEISSDGATVYTSEEVRKFLKTFGVNHRTSSAYNPHSNQRAEGGVKAAKRMIKENVGPGGSLDTDRFLAALLMHRNTPSTGTRTSPSEVIFGRKIKDLVPIMPGKLKMNPQWHNLLKLREEALAKRHLKRGEELSEHTRRLKPLTVGTSVTIQNQHGNSPKRWCNTGRIVEVGEFDKYMVKMDGSGRLTVRNRKFLKPITSFQEELEESSVGQDVDQPMRRSERLREKTDGAADRRAA